MPNDTDTRDRLAALIAAQSTPTRSEWLRRSRRVLWVGSTWALLSMAVLVRKSVFEQTLWLLVSFVTFAVLVTQSAYLLFNRAGSALGRPRTSLIVAGMLTLLTPVLVALSAEYLAAPPPQEVPLRAHLACFVSTLVIAAGPFVSLLWTLRGSDYVRPRATGLLAGALSGVVGGMGVVLHCDTAAVRHLLLGHVLPIFALGVLGWLLAARLIGGQLRFIGRAPPPERP